MYYEIKVPIVLTCRVFAMTKAMAEREALREADCFLAYAGAHDWNAVREEHDDPVAVLGKLVRGWAASG